MKEWLGEIFSKQAKRALLEFALTLTVPKDFRKKGISWVEFKKKKCLDHNVLVSGGK